MTEKLTIRDVAQIAGVSKATVSRVLNNKPDVDPHTRERVLQIMRERGFVRDFSAVQLASVSLRKKTRDPSGFPADFLWGAATSAYQIEGATQEDGRGPCIWDSFAREPGTIWRGQNADNAIDHYHHLEEDVALMAEMNLKAYRFSVSWSRVLPTGTGPINIPGLDFYDRLVDALLARHITPVLTLYHWDLPLTLHEQGGWLNRQTAYAFADYAEIVARRLGDRVPWWITFNEPWCSAYLGYGSGIHAPGIQNTQAAVTAGHHILLAHGLAVPRLRSQCAQEAKIGITLNLTPTYAEEQDEVVLRGVEQLDIRNNRWFLDPIFRGSYPETLFKDFGVAPPPIESEDMTTISSPLDFLGINYYCRMLLRASQNRRSPTTAPYEEVVPVPGATYTEMAWEIYPKGLRDIMLRVQREYAPKQIMITENGAAFKDLWDGRGYISDKRRIQYLREHIETLEEILALDVPLCGYFVWSLFDNFEWVNGYSKRFGLIYVDYETQRRIIKESGRWYASLIAIQQEAMLKAEQASESTL